MSAYRAKHPAAFINNIADEGTKEEALVYLQKEWDEGFEIRAEIVKMKELLRVAQMCVNPKGMEAWFERVSELLKK
jgi:hypothetical protein